MVKRRVFCCLPFLSKVQDLRGSKLQHALDGRMFIHRTHATVEVHLFLVEVYLFLSKAPSSLEELFSPP